MVYTEELFTIWPEDKVQENTSIDKNSRKFYNNFLNSTYLDVSFILNSLNGLEFSQSKTETLQNIYKINHNICGFAKIIKLRKIQHISAIIDFAFDFARRENTLTKHSVDYLVKLLLNTLLKLITDFKNEDCSSEDISLLVEECKVYLSKPLDSWLEKYKAQASSYEKKGFAIASSFDKATPTSNPTLQEPNKLQSSSESKKGIQEVPESVIIATQKIESENPELLDEPEELNIPIDKVGLISDFYEESHENLNKVGNKLVELESNPESTELVNELFRSIHTVKGGARLLRIIKIEQLSHSAENLLDLVRNKKLSPGPEVIDYLMEAKSLLSEMLEEVASKGPIRTRILPVIRKIQRVCSPELYENTVSEYQSALVKNMEERKVEEPILIEKKATPTPENNTHKKSVEEKPKEPTQRTSTKDKQESIRVGIDKLDEVINTASELSLSRIQFREHITATNRLIRDIKRALQNTEEVDSNKILDRISKSNSVLINDLRQYFEQNKIPVHIEVLSEMINRFYNELKQELSMRELSAAEELTLLLISFQEMKNSMIKNVDNLEALTSKLQNEVMNFRMVPIANLFERFPSLVRDMARQTGKKIKMSLSGQETELDRVMINTLIDPLLHIVRNSIDHGIESTEERIANGKPEIGNLTLSAYYQGSYAVIEIKDDGRGINLDAVLNKAIEKGLVSEQEAPSLSQKEIVNFIFHPGFSTAAQVTKLSGRGVGMDVVMSTIKDLQGSIEVYTKKSEGSIFYLRIPLTLAIVRVLLFDIGSQLLAFPMSNVDEIITISKDEIESFGNKFFYHLRSEIISLIHIADVLSIPHSSNFKEEIPLIILNDGNKKVGLVVDKILGRQEIVIKNLGNLLKKVPYIMGCTILSDRRLVMILNPREVIDSSTTEALEKSATKVMMVKREESEETHSILVVDDSPLQRKNIKSILTRSGFLVDEAENGFEAMKLVRFKKYSLFCVDLVMPLMDGFELVSRLKNLPLYKTIPVIVITAKHSQEDRERGLKVGANEFLEKPVDPEVLKELVNRYIIGNDERR